MIDTKALREKVLDLAIRGKLVPQDPDDEPASVLLERIRMQKEQMVKEGKLKAKDIKIDTIIFKGEDNLHYEKFQDGTVKSIEDEIPFEVPDDWRWCRLGLIFAHNTGKALNSSDTNGTKLTYITTSNLYWDRFELDSLKEMPFTDSEIEKCTVTKGDLLVCEGGDVGRAAIWMFDEEIRIQNHIHRLRPYITLSNRFFYYVFYLWKCIERIGGRGIGLQGFSSKALHQLIIPVPPFAEQYAIVSKLDYILDFIDDLEAQKIELSTVVASTKTKILDLAIRGKLVPQDPDDESASVLLERIRAEKEELIKQGKIKRDKKESIVFKGDDNSYYEKYADKSVKCINNALPFEVPNSWEWCRLNDIAIEVFAGGDKPQLTKKDRTTDAPIPIYANGVDNDGLYGYTNMPRVIEPSITISARGTIGFCCVREEPFYPIIRLITVTPHNTINLHFLSYIFTTMLETGTGSSIPQLTVPNVKPKLVPIPPHQEQNRIVTRVKDYFAILEAIEKSLN